MISESTIKYLHCISIFPSPSRSVRGDLPLRRRRVGRGRQQRGRQGAERVQDYVRARRQLSGDRDAALISYFEFAIVHIGLIVT